MKQLSLTHLVRQPAVPSEGRPPLLVLLHGVGSNEQDLFGLAPSLDKRFLIVSARAPITLDRGSYAWFHIQFTPTGIVIQPEEAEASRLLILKFVDELVETYGADPKRVYLMGFSQGCIMSLAASLTEPKKFAGVVGMSGRLMPEIEPKIAPAEELRGLPLMIVHGTQDQVLTVSYGRGIRDKLLTLPVDLTYREYAMPHTVSPESLADVAAWLKTRLG
ncbi:MAG: alpha/beta hydrolase-fold protein [Bryobacteraceae bacterium]